MATQKQIDMTQCRPNCRTVQSIIGAIDDVLLGADVNSSLMHSCRQSRPFPVE